MRRREFLRSGLAATASFVALGSGVWRALASHAAPVPGSNPYGALGPADANGFRLPPGFTSRVIGVGQERVEGTDYLWHWLPDGGATFATPDGGWIYVSNSEVLGAGGGAGAARFAADGSITDAYRILSRTNSNCAGGSTPWGTWLSCEEEQNGRVYECDPLGVGVAVPRLGLGTFHHEAAVVDPLAPHHVYLTEDRTDGCFYRFTPAAVGDLSDVFPSPILDAGTLEVAQVLPSGGVVWHEVPVPVVVVLLENEETTPTRHQVPEATHFNRLEGAWFDALARTVYFCETGTGTVWAYDADAATLEPLFSSTGTPGSPLSGADNVTVSPGGELFVCEDHWEDQGPLQVVLISPQQGVVAPFCEVVGDQHHRSELTGAAFDPSGTRMYVSSQRAFGLGATYEVSGPFVTTRA